MRTVYGLILGLTLMAPLAGVAQDNPTINAPNNNGIITQGQKGNNYLYQAPPPLPTGIYQQGQFVGSFSAIEGPANDQVTLLNPRISSGIVDLSRDVEVQGQKLHCPQLMALYRPNAIIGTINIVIAGPVACTVESD
ncbi:hypothetical protein [Acidisoma sp. S159]|uniref:hypothetical protein n=1 Tax=Acidisoma sp. S159 TaxID=1747225 RepID=UPI00131BB8BC|nr:hypothetical protein [Acidisoma sp. S159]